MRSRAVTIFLALCSAASFAMSVQGGKWWTIGEAEVGPFGAKRCFGGECMPAGLAWLGVDDRWIRVGMATWAAGLIAAFVLVLLSAGVASKRNPRLVAKTALVSIVTATITGGALFALFPRGDFPTTEIGRGAWLFAIAIATGATAAIGVLRRPSVQ